MPSLRIVQTLGTIEAPNGRTIVDQPSVKTVKAMVTLGRRHSVGVDSESVYSAAASRGLSRALRPSCFRTSLM
jgi:hypothetical protein